MKLVRGDIWFADLNPIRGSEQAGTRPVIIFQNDVINPYTRTVLAIPCTTNLRRADLPTCSFVQTMAVCSKTRLHSAISCVYWMRRGLFGFWGICNRRHSLLENAVCCLQWVLLSSPLLHRRRELCHCG